MSNQHMKATINTILLFCILTLAVLLRFIQIHTVPPSLSHDEVAIGYNAYSILKTGKDEYGTTFPILFRSFDDYKLPGMVYASVPSIALLGLNEIGVRFPSALFGSLAVLIFYGLCLELFEKKKISLAKTNISIALIPTFLFAISPWHINFSRQSFESNGALFFLMLGVYGLVRHKEKSMCLILASISFVVSLYFYYSVRLIIPFILLTYLISHYTLIKTNWRITSIALILGIILIFPLLRESLSSGGLARIQIVSVSNDKNYIERQRIYSEILAKNPNNVLVKIRYNRRTALFLTSLENYGKNLSFEHIFIKGTGSFGLQHLVEIPFLYLGIYMLFKMKNKEKWLYITWLLTAPLPGALSLDQPNALRTLPNAPMFSLLSGIGILSTVSDYKSKFARYALTGALCILFSVSLYKFTMKYFIEYPSKNSLAFGDGYKQMISYVLAHQSEYQSIYISGYYWRPYIFSLFWSAYDPSSYQANGSPSHYDTYYFGNAPWDTSGISLSNPGTSILSFTSMANGPWLFILSPTEYNVHAAELTELSKISGTFSQNVFVVAKRKNH